MSYDESERIKFFPKPGEPGFELRENTNGVSVHVDFVNGEVSNRPAEPSEPVRAVSLLEEHEIRVYKRQAVEVVAGWIDKDADNIHAFEKNGRCFLDYPNPDEYGVRLHVTGASWWAVLRQVMADLIRAGHLQAPENE